VSNEVRLSGRTRNIIELDDKGNIIIEADQVSIELINDSIKVLAQDIILSADLSKESREYSIVYGEKLVDILRFILRTLKMHKHPPNASPTPDFYPEADRILENIENILNTNVRTK
jgi:hypothetical protein